MIDRRDLRPHEFEAPKPRLCPFCSYECEMATSTSKDEPRAPLDGDLSFCLRCGEWSVFQARAPGGLRKPIFTEYEQIASNPRIRRVREVWLQTTKPRIDKEGLPSDRTQGKAAHKGPSGR